MKIIKQVDTSNWKHNVTCKECDTELEIETNDICFERYSGDQREPGYDLYYVLFPVCDESITIPPLETFSKALMILIQKKNKVR